MMVFNTFSISNSSISELRRSQNKIWTSISTQNFVRNPKIILRTPCGERIDTKKTKSYFQCKFWKNHVTLCNVLRITTLQCISVVDQPRRLGCSVVDNFVDALAAQQVPLDQLMSVGMQRCSELSLSCRRRPSQLHQIQNRNTP